LREEMTELEKEEACGVAWIIYRKTDGIPDTSPSQFQRRPIVRQGTIWDMQEYLESSFQDWDEMGMTDPMRQGLWRALKVSKEGRAIYGDYSVPLCSWKLGERWGEKDLLMAKSYQLAVLMQDKRYDCLRNYKQGYMMDVPEGKKESLCKELEALDNEGKEIERRLTDMGVSFEDQQKYIREH